MKAGLTAAVYNFPMVLVPCLVVPEVAFDDLGVALFQQMLLPDAEGRRLAKLQYPGVPPHNGVRFIAAPEAVSARSDI